MTNAPQFLSSIAAIAARYDAFILDLWGVIHDGQELYPKVKECLRQLRRQNKKIIFLSNAPRRAETVQEALLRMGIEEALFDAIITSGETAYRCLAHPDASFFVPRGKNYFYIGLEKDRGILGGLDYREVETPESADFLLLAHSYVDNQPLVELLPLLERSRKAGLTALCINPDREVVRMGGKHVYCAGLLAEEYKKLGGEVIYFGKPHRAVYEACLRIFANLPSPLVTPAKAGVLAKIPASAGMTVIGKPRIIAVGDNLATDITGANRTGLASVLVTGGVLRETVGTPLLSHDKSFEAKCRELFITPEITPTYVVPVFNW